MTFILCPSPCGRQVEIMHQLGKHANIVCLYEVFEDAGAIHLILVRTAGGLNPQG